MELIFLFTGAVLSWSFVYWLTRTPKGRRLRGKMIREPK